MRFVRRDRGVVTSVSLTVLCSVLLFVACSFHAASLAAQSSPDRTDSPEQARKLATQTMTITGCLRKGYEPDEFQITSEDGKVWGLRSSAVKLDGYLGHKVTVSGLITHESKAHVHGLAFQGQPDDRVQLVDEQDDLLQGGSAAHRSTAPSVHCGSPPGECRG